MTPLITIRNAYFFSCLSSICYTSDQVQNRENILNPALREQKFIYYEMEGKGTQGGINVTVGDGVVVEMRGGWVACLPLQSTARSFFQQAVDSNSGCKKKFH